jgi:O-antigen/teichoic acid export membrane protein
MGTMGLIAGGVNLFLNFILISRYLAMGAAWATCLSFLIMAALSYAFSQKAYKIPYSIPKLCMPLAAAFVLYMASTLVMISSPFLSMAVKLLFLPGFVGVLYLLGFFDRAEIDRLRSALGLFPARVAASGQ